MDHNTREQRRRETEVRLLESHADIATSWLSRTPSIAATSVRGGMLALLVKLRHRPRTASERESVHRIVASLGKLKGAAMKVHRARLPDGTRVAVNQAPPRERGGQRRGPGELAR